jgi:predicted MFS family arabinose efflux permease
MSALMSGGWSLGSVASAAIAPGSPAVRRVLAAGPLALAASLGLLAVFTPISGGAAVLVVIGAALALLGLGIGICWPHLGAAVFAAAPEDERNLASASITTVIMLGNAFGSALAGMVTNLAGIDEPARAAQFTFGLFAAAPLLALLLMRRVRG